MIVLLEFKTGERLQLPGHVVVADLANTLKDWRLVFIKHNRVVARTSWQQ